MTDSRTVLEGETVQAWKLAADLLDVFVIAPFEMPGAEEQATCIAFLPHFGGPNGMLIEGITPPNYTSNPSLEVFADEWGMYTSAIFGPIEHRPSWLPTD